MFIKQLKILFFLSIIFFLSQSCDEDPEVSGRTSSKKNIIINPSITYQTISGFGGANQMWGTQFPNATEMEKAFGSGIDNLGLSIFRVRISSNPNEWPLIVDVAKEAKKYGAKILASPWSPPPSLKSNNNEVGGYLLEENYAAFTQHINDFVDYMDDNGVEIDAISIQNEPDIEVSYESCDWTAPEMRDFLKSQGSNISNVKIAAPESFNFNQSYTNLLLNDEDAANEIDIVAGHIYGGGQAAYPLAEQLEKEIWMTEYLLNLNVGDWENAEDATKWDETLTMLNTIHTAMENNWNAYIWWYLKRYYSFIGDGDEGTTEGEILKRGYAFSHFSKFVRPGYKRVNIEDVENTGLEITAYYGEDNVVVVIINSSTEAIGDINLQISNLPVVSAQSYTTTLSKNLEEKELTVTNGEISNTILANSVTTVVLSL